MFLHYVEIGVLFGLGFLLIPFLLPLFIFMFYSAIKLMIVFCFTVKLILRRM